MNRTDKKITVRFFSIESHSRFFDDFIATYTSSHESSKVSRILNIRNTKHLIKIHEKILTSKPETFLISVIKERNTWQVKGLKDGSISGLPLNQGVIGDPYYFLLIPHYKLILGLSTAPTGNLKPTASSVLKQFNNNRTEQVSLEVIPKDKELSKLKELSVISKLHFKVSAGHLDEDSEETPKLLKQIKSAPFLTKDSEISLTFSENDIEHILGDDLISIINYLSENDGCSALTIDGIINGEEKPVHLNLNKACVEYKTTLSLRDKYIGESVALKTLLYALDSLDSSMLPKT